MDAHDVGLIEKRKKKKGVVVSQREIKRLSSESLEFDLDKFFLKDVTKGKKCRK